MGAEVDVLLTAVESGFLRIEAGANSSYVYNTLPAKVAAKGRVVIPIQRLIGLPLREELKLTASSSELSFKTGSFTGTLKASSDVDRVIAQRPLKKFKPTVHVPTEVFKDALSRVSLGSSLPGAQLGVRVQVGEDLTLSTTDQYRAVIYKDELALAQTELDVLLHPDFLHGAMSKILSPEVGMGVHKGVFHLSTDTVSIYHPSIQQQPEDIEDWMDNGIDYSKKECTVTVSCDRLSKNIREVSAVQLGSLAYDTHFDLLIKGQLAHLRCKSDHGSTKSSVELFRSNATKTITKLSSKYTLEMLHLIRAGDSDISFWSDFILLEGHEGKFRGLIPTVAA